MLNKIIDLGIQGRLLVVLVLFGIMAGAAILLPRLNLDAFPDVTNVQVSINTEARGLAAEEVAEHAGEALLPRERVERIVARRRGCHRQ